MLRERAAQLLASRIVESFQNFSGFPVPGRLLGQAGRVFLSFLTMRYSHALDSLYAVYPAVRVGGIIPILLRGVDFVVQSEGAAWIAAEGLWGVELPPLGPEEVEEAALTAEAWSGFWERNGPRVVALALRGDTMCQRLIDQPRWIRLRSGWYQPESIKADLELRIRISGKRPKWAVQLAVETLEVAPPAFEREGERIDLSHLAAFFLRTVRSWEMRA